MPKRQSKKEITNPELKAKQPRCSNDSSESSESGIEALVTVKPRNSKSPKSDNKESSSSPQTCTSESEESTSGEEEILELDDLKLIAAVLLYDVATNAGMGKLQAIGTVAGKMDLPVNQARFMIEKGLRLRATLTKDGPEAAGSTVRNEIEEALAQVAQHNEEEGGTDEKETENEEEEKDESEEEEEEET